MTTEPDDLVQIMPAGGWRVEYRVLADSNRFYSEPLVGWGLTRDGDVVALVTDDRGSVLPIALCGDVNRVFHPEIEA
jgi:hypothetical protein